MAEVFNLVHEDRPFVSALVAETAAGLTSGLRSVSLATRA